MATHIGPRGGKYRVVNGRKRYDVPNAADRIRSQRAIAATATGSALMAEAEDAPGQDWTSPQILFGAGLIIAVAVVAFLIYGWWLVLPFVVAPALAVFNHYAL